MNNELLKIILSTFVRFVRVSGKLVYASWFPSGVFWQMKMFLHFREMFWSDWGHTAKIEMSDMDGQNRQVLIKSGITWPNGLAVDIYQPETSRILYYTDAYKDIIGSYDLKAKKHKVHSQF